MPDLTAGSKADRRRFLALLKDKSYEKRKVVLSSGRESDFYIDCKQTTLDADLVVASEVVCVRLRFLTSGWGLTVIPTFRGSIWFV